jgi:DNA-binding NtrC family response regulator
LFGHIRGGYATVAGTRAGLVQTAAEGTLLLDEIGELEPHSQGKLLRLLEDGSYEQLGSDAPRRCHARIVVATHLDVEQEVAAGRIRKDLYFRMRAHTAHLPPLRDRLGDLPMLVAHFLARAAAELEKTVPTEPPELYQLLRSYHFPGNVRELRDMCGDAVAQHQGHVLSMRSFREHIAHARKGIHPVMAATAAGAESDDSWLPYPLPMLDALEEAAVREALRRADGNQVVAAASLGMSHSAFNRRALALRRKQHDGESPDAEH